MKKTIFATIFATLFLFPALAQAAPPVLINPPSISGDKQIYEPLLASPGDWGNMELGSYFYEWQRRVDGRWVSAVDFDQNYIPGDRDVGRRLRVEVTAINAEGQATSVSPSYYIRGSGVNGVQIYPSRRGSVALKGRVADWGRALCLEGYCKIRRVRAKAIISGRSYRLRVRFQKSYIGPDRVGRIKVILPASLVPYAAYGLAARMYVRASSTNGDVRARVMRTRIVS